MRLTKAQKASIDAETKERQRLEIIASTKGYRLSRVIFKEHPYYLTTDQFSPPAYGGTLADIAAWLESNG